MNISTSTMTEGANRFRACPGALALLVAFLVTARADVIYLRSGEKVIGKVVADEGAKVVFRSQALGRLEIPRDAIERIELEPAPVAQPASPSSIQPFVPPPPVAQGMLAQTNLPAVGNTNAPARHRWFFQAKTPGTDWIQLKSGEWLRGKLHGMQNRKLEFESDEMDDLEFDWKEIHQVISPRALVSYGERESAWGSVRVDRENVVVTGDDEVTFSRNDLIGIAPGSPRERDYWSGRFNIGLNLRAGNTEQADLVTKMKLERRTPHTHLELEYIGNFGELDGVETVNNQRITEFFDLFLTRRLFLRVPQSEYYSDPFQNIGHRYTVGAGAGYYFIDKPKIEWQVAGGPAYQFIEFDTVQPGQAREQSTPAFALQSSFEIDLTKQIDLELDYRAIVAKDESGGVTHHGAVTLEIDLTRQLDLDISFVWDRIGSPQPDSAGITPKNDDYRLNLSLGVKF